MEISLEVINFINEMIDSGEFTYSEEHHSKIKCNISCLECKLRYEFKLLETCKTTKQKYIDYLMKTKQRPWLFL